MSIGDYFGIIFDSLSYMHSYYNPEFTFTILLPFQILQVLYSRFRILIHTQISNFLLEYLTTSVCSIRIFNQEVYITEIERVHLSVTIEL